MQDRHEWDATPLIGSSARIMRCSHAWGSEGPFSPRYLGLC
jgi:hypothetical protein